MLLALGLAAIYASASVGKFRASKGFEEYLRPFAGQYSRKLAAVVIGLEVMLSVGLAGGGLDRSVASIAGVASAVFLVTATAFHAMLLADSRPARCNCFGDRVYSTDRVAPAWRPALFALRNGVLVSISIAVAGGSFPAIALVLALVGVMIAGALLLSVHRERMLLATEPHPLTSVFAPTMATLQAHGWWLNGRPRPF